MSNLQVYLARNNVQAGPYELDQLNKMLASGEVSLNDLMWHEGMDNWQRVGIMTKETLYYMPSSPPSQGVTLSKTTSEASSATGERTSVDRLYGKTPTIPSTPSSNKPNTPAPSFSDNAKDMLAAKKVGNNQLASVGSRISAVLVDQIIALACFIPLYAALDYNFESLAAARGNFTAMSALMESLPQHLVSLSGLMLMALLVVQIVMLIKRGQSLGKLIMGVRILDVNTHKVPSATNIILIRTVLTNLAYGLSFIGLIILIADFTVMLFDKQRRSLHDKLAKTYVVKAEEQQLAYQKKSNSKKN